MNKQILSGDFEIPEIVNEDCGSLIRSMMSLDPNKRPTFEEIFNSKWVRKIRSKSYLSNSAPSHFKGIPKQSANLYDFIHHSNYLSEEKNINDDKNQISSLSLSASAVLNSSDHLSNYPHIFKPIPVSQSAVQAHEVSDDFSPKVFPISPKVRRSSFGVHVHRSPAAVLQNLRGKQQILQPSLTGRNKDCFRGKTYLLPTINMAKEPLGV